MAVVEKIKLCSDDTCHKCAQCYEDECRAYQMPHDDEEKAARKKGPTLCERMLSGRLQYASTARGIAAERKRKHDLTEEA